MDTANEQPTDEQPEKLDLSAFYGDESKTVVPESESKDLQEEQIPDEEDIDTDDTDESEDDFEDSDTENDDTVEVVEIDGEEYTIDQLKEWKKDGLRQKDYTKKTQAAAEKAKEADLIISVLGKTVDELEALKSEFQSDIEILEKQLTDDLLEDDITEYTKLERKIAKEKDKLNKATAKLQEAKKQQDLVEQQENGKLLTQLVPELKDQKKAQALFDDLEKLYNELEIPIKEAEKVRSPYFWLLSKKFIELKKQTAKAKRVTKTSKVSKSVKKTSAQTKPTSVSDMFYKS